MPGHQSAICWLRTPTNSADKPVKFGETLRSAQHCGPQCRVGFKGRAWSTPTVHLQGTHLIQGNRLLSEQGFGAKGSTRGHTSRGELSKHCH
jgi:hypothetical protein